MKKNFVKILIFFAFILLFKTIAFSKNNVSDISIEVVVHDNGSATIIQNWQGTFNEGSEVYIPIEDKSIAIKNFQVSRNGQNFYYVDNWDVNGNLYDKQNKCGIVQTKKGIELCFGITEYGENTYTFSYTVDPFVKSYTDYDGFNFRFINPNMGTFPTNAVWTLKLENGRALSYDIAKIWGFGFDGSVGIKDDIAIGFTNTSLKRNANMTIMMSFNKGLISPNVSVRESFDTLRDKAFEGSSYTGEELSPMEKLMRYLTIGAIIFFVVASISAFIESIKRKNRLKKFYKEANYFRDIPNGGNITMSYVLYEDFDLWKNKESNVIGAIIMILINRGYLLPIQDKKYGLFGRETIETNLRVVREPQDEILKKLFSIIVKAAGDDGILQENELKNYGRKDYKALYNYIDTLRSKGHNELNLKHAYTKALAKDVKHLTDEGKKELEEVYGLRKFLDEFTLINERGIMEGVIWENLMVYATLFGIAKKVLKELKNVYPEKIVEIEKYENTVLISHAYYRALYVTSHSAKMSAERARAAKGLGGDASFGGGGGFSGGGMGGGTR